MFDVENPFRIEFIKGFLEIEVQSLVRILSMQQTPLA